MQLSKARLRGAMLAMALVLVLAGSAHAQFRRFPVVIPPRFQVNPAMFMRTARVLPLPSVNPFVARALANNIQARSQALASFQGAMIANSAPYLRSYFSPAQAAVNFASATVGWSPLARSLAANSMFSSASPFYNPYAYSPLSLMGAATLTSNPYTLGAATIASNPYALSAGLGSYGGYGAISSGYGGYGGVGGYGMMYNPYGTYYYDPYGGYFRGVGNLITSEGQFYNQYQQARQKSVEVERAKVDLRKALFDEWRYYREHMPKYEDLRQKSIERERDYALHHPAITDVLNASSLNTLLAHLKDVQSKGLKGPAIDLDPDILKKINVRTDRGGNIGLLKNGGKLNWPLSLRMPIFDDLRKSFEMHVEQAVERAKVDGKPIDAALLRDLKSEVAAMNDTLDKNVNKLSLTAFNDGKRYLNHLSDAVRALGDPNVADYFHGKYSARGKSVDKLIDYMIANGLKFAPSTPGDENAYRALQTYLAAYDAGLTRLASAPRAPREKEAP